MTVPTEYIDTVVIGAGQAGLAASYHLSQKDVPHVVLERGRVGERWRSERWDNLHFQFPASLVSLPGSPYDGDAPDSFMHRDRVVRTLERYAQNIRAPVRCGVTVRRVRSNQDSERKEAAHNDGLWAVAWGSSSNRILTGSVDETVKVWRGSDVSAEHVLDGHQLGVVSVAATSDGGTGRK